VNVEQRQAAADPQTKPPDLGGESACFIGSYRLQPPSPFIVITLSHSSVINTLISFAIL